MDKEEEAGPQPLSWKGKKEKGGLREDNWPLKGACGNVEGEKWEGLGDGGGVSDFQDVVRTECSRSQSPDKWESGGTATLAKKIWVMGHWLQKEGWECRT